MRSAIGQSRKQRSRGRRASREAFGSLVFNDEVQQTRLPKPIYHALRRTMTHGEPLDTSVADAVAAAMKDWAVEHGATHYTHWFQPLTGITAEKHDSFLSPTGDGKAVAEFSGKELVSGEPDASSFPSGGMRATFEARGYTAWDPTSPPWLLKSGSAVDAGDPDRVRELDRRSARQEDAAAPLDGSAVEAGGAHPEAVRLDTPSASITTCGPEQEYFLIDQHFYLRRPDLINAGRTLFGAKPPKGQELEDQYFGAIPDRVLAFMTEAEAELYKIGVPVKTRHNEVAPSQYEIAPVFENANVATDHQMMMMETLQADRRRSTAWRACCTRSRLPASTARASTSTGRWATTRATTCSGPATTRTTTCSSWCSAPRCIRAVDKWQGLLRASIASAGNDHRLGANEAPPAIISIFLGDMLTDIFEQIEKGGAKSTKQRRRCSTPASSCCRSCRATPATATAPARSPSPATSSSSAPCRRTRASRYPNIVLNVAVTESLDYIATELEKAVKGGKTLERGRRRAAAEGDQGEQADHLQRQRLLEGVGEGSRQARAAEPEEHRRRAAAAGHQGCRQAVRDATRSSTSASCTRATRSWSRPTTRPSTSKAS